MQNPIRCNDARFLTVKMASERYNICPNLIRSTARDGGALLKIGKSVRIDTEKLDKYLDKVCVVE
jgi:hypothetical protein